MTAALTEIEQATATFIGWHERTHGRKPYMREIAAHFGVTTQSIWLRITRMRAKGFDVTTRGGRSPRRQHKPTRRYVCRTCGGLGHNSRTCAMNRILVEELRGEATP